MYFACSREAGGSVSIWTWSWRRCADKQTRPSFLSSRLWEWAGTELSPRPPFSAVTHWLGGVLGFNPCGSWSVFSMIISGSRRCDLKKKCFYTSCSGELFKLHLVISEVVYWLSSSACWSYNCGSPCCRVSEEVTTQLLRSANHCIERDGILATRLCTHKDDVELTNENKLKQLPGWSHWNLILCVKCDVVCWSHQVVAVLVSLSILWRGWVWMRSPETEIVSRNPPSDSWVA